MCITPVEERVSSLLSMPLQAISMREGMSIRWNPTGVDILFFKRPLDQKIIGGRYPTNVQIPLPSQPTPPFEPQTPRKAEPSFVDPLSFPIIIHTNIIIPFSRICIKVTSQVAFGKSHSKNHDLAAMPKENPSPFNEPPTLSQHVPSTQEKRKDTTLTPPPSHLPSPSASRRASKAATPIPTLHYHSSTHPSTLHLPASLPNPFPHSPSKIPKARCPRKRTKTEHLLHLVGRKEEPSRASGNTLPSMKGVGLGVMD